MTLTEMPKPDASKPPMKANAFEVARGSNTQLLPLFPYAGPGDIVPCCSALRSDGGGGGVGYFLHVNTVDEVAVSFGSSGRSRTGDVWCGPKTHGVGGGSGEPSFRLIVITQRQLDDGAQPETVVFQCEACNTELLRHEFEGVDAAPDSPVPPLPTLVGSYEAARRFNESDAVRRCPNCGHDNPPFPLQKWGWARYAYNTGVAEEAWEALKTAAR